MSYSTCNYTVTLKPRVRGHSGSSELTRIDLPHRTSY